jgi:uncharacterized RDD family membrane protein YckC
MKCPKCGYLGLDEPSRCRHCGFDFSLSDFSDLAIRSNAGAGEPLPALPLFARNIKQGDDDAPLIVLPSAPRAPLAVRRSTPDLPRPRTVPPRTATLELDLAPTDEAVSRELARPVSPVSTVSPVSNDAGVSLRLIAAAVDSGILLAIDILVVYFTMQICAVSISELGLLPKVPLAAFLVVQNVGYLLAFTAGGQTLGKMAAGLRIVPMNAGESLNMNCALKRTVASLVLAVPAGLGLLSACFSHDHRGLHDRFAGTRVVRASI